MIRFYCPCGAEIFFDSRICEACKSPLAFNPRTLKFDRLEKERSTLITHPTAATYVKTVSTTTCNWLAESDAPQGLCLAANSTE